MYTLMSRTKYKDSVLNVDNTTTSEVRTTHIPITDILDL
jgi:hypothetical protein